MQAKWEIGVESFTFLSWLSCTACKKAELQSFVVSPPFCLFLCLHGKAALRDGQESFSVNLTVFWKYIERRNWFFKTVPKMLCCYLAGGPLHFFYKKGTLRSNGLIIDRLVKLEGKNPSVPYTKGIQKSFTHFYHFWKIVLILCLHAVQIVSYTYTCRI